MIIKLGSELPIITQDKCNHFLSVYPGGGILDSTRVIGLGTGRTFWLREVNTVTYAGNYEYENDTLSKKFFADGYIDCSGDEPVACFYLKDHLGNVRMVVDEEGNIVQVNDYYPFGALYGSGTGDAAQRYKYNGKELDRMHGLDWYDYGARWMDPVLCRFTTMDPLCEKYYDTSPYAYCANNPMKYIDPDGRLISPIYDPNGNLLGTDDQGLQGDAMILKKEDFKQGMSHDDASKLNLGLHSLDENVREKVMASVKDLESRPDYDGVLTLSEANNWYRNGNGQPLFVDASKINLSPMTKEDLHLNKVTAYNFLHPMHTNLETGLVYGTLGITLLDDTGKVRMGNKDGLIDIYDFDYQKGRLFRNFATKIGEIVAGQGRKYDIFGYGYGKVN